MSFEDNYSRTDRLVHRLAFSSRSFQLTAADLESTMFAKRFRDVAVDRPVFITSLPRAGTTLMLDIVHHSPRFATHSYRDMPFVFAPMLWRSMSAGFHKPAQLAERAHGDGMQVGFDSPEAFEEILWRLFWPEKFREDAIELWAKDEDARDFDVFFADHMRKIVALKSEKPGVRYISKNNANIGRIPFLRTLLPDAIILVPVREPLDQAVSLHQQHLRFLKVHKTEAFSKRYMRDIGHLEFGELHRPLLFPGLARLTDGLDSSSLEYWVAYWIAAFEFVLTHLGDVRLISYERACADTRSTVAVLKDVLGVPADDTFDVPSDALHPPRSYRGDVRLPGGELVKHAQDVYAECLRHSLL